MKKVYFRILYTVLCLTVWVDLAVFYMKPDLTAQTKPSVRHETDTVAQSRTPLLVSTKRIVMDDNNKALCSTNWINGTTLQFVAFSVNNFSAVNFMMPAEYSVNNESAYSCLFRQDTRPIITSVTKLGGPMVVDVSERTLHLRCKIPEEIKNTDHDSVIFTLDLGNGEQYAIRICRDYASFSNSPLNQYRSFSGEKARIAVCTMVTYGYTDLLKIWLEYNTLIGIKHFYIYDNAPYHRSRLHYDLQHYIEIGIVTVVPWYPETWSGFNFYSTVWVRHQIWSQNDCIQRYGAYHEWLGIFDVDEFPISLQRNLILSDILGKVPAKHCSLMMENCMALGENKINSSLIEDPSKLLTFFQQDTVNKTGCDKRLKHFVRPSKIYYFRIHWLSKTVNCSGSYKATDLDELRVNHYKANYPRPK